MFIIKYKKIFLSVSGVLIVASIASILFFGLRPSIDFRGGAIMEVNYEGSKPAPEELDFPLKELDYSILLQETGETGYIIKSRDLNEVEHATLLKTLSLSDKYKVNETSFNSIGPSVGRELTRKAIVAIVLVALGIILFIAYAFRRVSRPVSSWQYGLIAVVTLLHDVLIPVGIFAFLGHLYGVEADTLFVVAILTILGLSVSDTIVIFDRIRENLAHESNKEKADFPAVVGQSLKQSYSRSIATSLTVILALLALVFYGPESTKYFAMMLTAGMFFGTYSSIFLASPLLVIVRDWQKKS